MNARYARISNELSVSSSSLDSADLEMTSLQNDTTTQNADSPANYGLQISHDAVPRANTRTRRPAFCDRKTMILLIILIPIGLAGLVFVILLGTGTVNMETLGISNAPATKQKFVTCAADEMRCKNGYECLHKKYVCDKEEHCSDNSDEQGCKGGCPLSPNLFYFCKNGNCIKKQWRCDREPDCFHGDDEVGCEKCSPTAQFTCNNYECVGAEARCDGLYDCLDRSDEYGCFKLVSDTVKYSYNGTRVDLCHSADVTAAAPRICALLGHRSEGATSSAIPRDEQSAVAVSIKPFPKDGQTNGTFLLSPKTSCREAVNIQCKNCGQSTKQIWAAYLVGGKGGSPITDWPWQVKLNIGNTICGGSIVADHWILTAAHCVSNYSSRISEITAVYGTNQFNGDRGVQKKIKRIVMHPQFRPTIYREYFTTYSYDLALLQVDTIEYSHKVQPVCLPTQDDLLSNQTNCYITGFGSIVANPFKPIYPSVLQEGKTRVWSRVGCESQYQRAYRLSVPDDWLCAGYRTAGVDSCGGDSGGPLVCLMNGRWVLQGVVSWGSTCKQSLPSAYARVAKATDWIDHYINN